MGLLIQRCVCCYILWGGAARSRSKSAKEWTKGLVVTLIEQVVGDEVWGKASVAPPSQGALAACPFAQDVGDMCEHLSAPLFRASGAPGAGKLKDLFVHALEDF